MNCALTFVDQNILSSCSGNTVSLVMHSLQGNLASGGNARKLAIHLLYIFCIAQRTLEQRSDLTVSLWGYLLQGKEGNVTLIAISSKYVLG